MHFLVATDDNYVPQLATLLVSLVEKGCCPEAVIHVAHYAVGQQKLERLQAFAADLFPGKMRFVDCDLRGYQHFRLDEHITQAAYIRLFLSELLPESVDRVLYLDTDIIIRRPIGALRLD